MKVKTVQAFRIQQLRFEFVRQCMLQRLLQTYGLSHHPLVLVRARRARRALHARRAPRPRPHPYHLLIVISSSS